MLWLPTDRPLAEIVIEPLTSVIGDEAGPPSIDTVTVPVGVAVAGENGLTLIVTLSAWPKTGLGTDCVMASCEFAIVTVWTNAVSVLAALKLVVASMWAVKL